MAQSIFDYIYGEDRFKPSNDGVLAQIDALNRRSDPNPPTQAPTQVTPMPKSLYENMRRVANDEVDLPDTANILRNVSEYGVMGGDLIDFVAENPSLSAELGGELVSGLVQQAVPEEFEWNSEAEDMVDSIVDAIADDYIKNYGSLDGFAEYVRETPVDAFADISGAGVLAKVGKEALVKAAKNPNLQEQVFQALETMMDKTGGRSYAVEKAKGVEVDSRFGQGRVLDQKQMNDLQTETSTNTLQDIQPMSIFNMEGMPFVVSMADRTEAGKILTNVNDVELDEAVKLRGGQNYMFDKENIRQGNLWASDKSPSTALDNKADELRRKYKENPLFMPYAMSPTGGDFSHQTLEVMINYADTVLPRKLKTELNKKIKEIIPEWKGIGSPKTQEILNNAMPMQRKIVQQMMDRDFRDVGLSRPQARVSVTEVDQLNNVLPLEARNVGILTGGTHNLSNHPTYSSAVEGYPLGKFKEKFSVMDILSDDELNKGLVPRNWGRGNDLSPLDEFSFRMRPQSGLITEDKLKLLEEKIKQGLLD